MDSSPYRRRFSAAETRERIQTVGRIGLSGTFDLRFRDPAAPNCPTSWNNVLDRLLELLTLTYESKAVEQSEFVLNDTPRS